MLRWLRWLLERDIVSTPTVEALSIRDIDQALTHWSGKLHVDPDPISRWATLETCNMWLDARNRLRELDEG